MSASSRRAVTRTARSAWRSTSLALVFAASIYSAGCASSRQGSGDVPDCPPWTSDAIEELEAILARGESPALEAHIAEQLAYCEAIERWNDESLATDPRSCWPRTWSEWASLLFALECPR